jgi:hypothetical protein
MHMRVKPSLEVGAPGWETLQTRPKIRRQQDLRQYRWSDRGRTLREIPTPFSWEEP